MRDKVTKKYSNGEITVVWKPDACIHSALCWKGLGSVFDPKRRPWVKVEGGTTEQIIAQVEKCPSGALSYFQDSEEEKSSAKEKQTVIEASLDGPLLVSGDIVLRYSDGTEEIRRTKTALCRCGQSGTKPFCDGTHKKVGFTG